MRARSTCFLTLALVVLSITGCTRRRAMETRGDAGSASSTSATPTAAADAAVEPSTIFTGAFLELAGIDRARRTFLLGTRGGKQFQHAKVTSGYALVDFEGRVQSHLDLPPGLPVPQPDGVLLAGDFEVFVNRLDAMARELAPTSADERELSLFIGLDPDPRAQDGTRQPVELNFTPNGRLWISGMLGHDCWPLDRQAKRFRRGDGCRPPIVHPWWSTESRCFIEAPAACCEDCTRGSRWCTREGCIFFGERAGPPASFWITGPSPPHPTIARGRVVSSMPFMARSPGGNVLLALQSGGQFVTAVLEPGRSTARALRHRPRHAIAATAAWLDDATFVLHHRGEMDAPPEPPRSYDSVDNKLELWRLDRADAWTDAPEISDIAWSPQPAGARGPTPTSTRP